MKTLLSSKTLIALAVAVAAAAAAYEIEANEQPIPPPASVSALPEGIQPGSPVAEVVKLVQAGVDVGVIQTFISNCPSGFNLDADKIIILTDAGLPGDLMKAMFAHDKALMASISTAASTTPVTPLNSQPDTTAPPVVTDDSVSAPPQEVTLNYFDDNLAPYGSWVTVDGYGRCWRPNIVIYDSTWRPYCDRGRWFYTDCGWYWDSDYSWGATFHYGRWFNSPRYGWCWWPDTIWAPSWVTWRSCNDYCGWAPLPPFTVFQPGIGFCYRGNNVAVGFDFGLGANSFTFVSSGNFCQPQPRHYCVPQPQVSQIFSQTTVINNFNANNRHRLQNNGISTTVIGAAARHPVQTVPVGSLASTGRHGWTGGSSRAHNHGSAATGGNSVSRNFSGADLRHGPVVRNDGSHVTRPNNDMTTVRRAPSVSPGQIATRPAETPLAARVPATSPASAQNLRQNQNPTAARDLVLAGHPAQNIAPAVNNHPVAAAAPDRSQNRNTWSAGADNNRQNRQPIRTYTPPATIDRPQVSLPVRTVAAPPAASGRAVPAERPQMSRNETRQSISQSQSAPRNIPPAAPAPSQPQPSGNGGYGRGQALVAQNH